MHNIYAITNLYASQYLEKEQGNLRPHSVVHEWKPTDGVEMLTLSAVLILMGIIHKPRLTVYFKFEFINIYIAQNVQMYLNALYNNKTWWN